MKKLDIEAIDMFIAYMKRDLDTHIKEFRNNALKEDYKKKECLFNSLKDNIAIKYKGRTPSAYWYIGHALDDFRDKLMDEFLEGGR